MENQNERMLWDRQYIASFKDPTVALETTQSNQTYVFKQKHETHGDVQDERNLSPDYNPNYFYRQEKGLTYQSTDQMEWELLNPTPITQLTVTPNTIIDTSTTLVNDYQPTARSRYQKAIVQSPISTMQTQVGRINPYNSWRYASRSATGQADR